MSIKRLTLEEMATYLVGLAVMRQFDYATRDPETQKEIAAVWNWIEHWLTSDERMTIAEATGWVHEEDLPEGLRDLPENIGREHPPGEEDDDLPF